MRLNLLPEKLVQSENAARALRVWAWLGLAAVTTGGAICASQYLGSYHLQVAVDELSREADGIQRIAIDANRLQARIAATNSDLAAIDADTQEQQVLALLGFVGRCVRQSGGGVQLSHMNVQLPPSATEAQSLRLAPAPARTASTGAVDARAAAVRAVADNAPPFGTLTIDGVAPDADAISRLVAILRESGPLTDIELKSATEESSSQGALRRFNIECRFVKGMRRD